MRTPKPDQKTRPKVLNHLYKQKANPTDGPGPLNKLDEFLGLLKDGGWHNLTSIVGTLKLSPGKVEKTVEILAKQDLIRHNPKARKVKISPDWIALLGEEEYL